MWESAVPCVGRCGCDVPEEGANRCLPCHRWDHVWRREEFVALKRHESLTRFEQSWREAAGGQAAVGRYGYTSMLQAPRRRGVLLVRGHGKCAERFQSLGGIRECCFKFLGRYHRIAWRWKKHFTQTFARRLPSEQRDCFSS